MKRSNYNYPTALIVLSLFMTGCMGGKTALHGDSSLRTQDVAVVYRTTVHHPGPQSILVISEIEEVDGNKIITSPRKSPTYREEGIIEVLPGKHTIGVRPWSMIDDSSFMFLGGGGTLVPGGSVKWHRPEELSEFNLTLKAGKTYVLFIPNAAAMTTPLPKEICITEDNHDAPGHKTVPLGYQRTPSPRATVVQCIAQDI